MNKTIITMIAIIVIMGAILTAFIINQPKQEKTVITNSEEEKTSPNCSLTIKKYYKKCGHMATQYYNLPEEYINLDKEQLNEKYGGYTIEKFASNEVVLYQEQEGECGEHYLVKDKGGLVTIFQILEDGTQKELEETGITTEYLPETDKINMRDGIKVNGKQALNQLIEDFE